MQIVCAPRRHKTQSDTALLWTAPPSPPRQYFGLTEQPSIAGRAAEILPVHLSPILAMGERNHCRVPGASRPSSHRAPDRRVESAIAPVGVLIGMSERRLRRDGFGSGRRTANSEWIGLLGCDQP